MKNVRTDNVKEFVQSLSREQMGAILLHKMMRENPVKAAKIVRKAHQGRAKAVCERIDKFVAIYWDLSRAEKASRRTMRTAARTLSAN